MRQKAFKLLSEYFQIALGIALASIGLKAFLLPNGFLDGGVTGIAILVSTTLGGNVSLLLVLFSIPFLIMAYFTVSKRIVYKSIISITTLALCIHLVHFPVITEDKLLIAIFGGLLVGTGIGIAIRNGTVLDGSEILGIFLNDRFGISIGQIILGFNIILFSVAATILSLELALYSILTYLVTAKVTDFIIKGFEDFIGVMIVSQRFPEIRRAIIEELGTGITIYRGEGGFNQENIQKDIQIIHSIINRIDIRKMYRMIEHIDPNAFIVEYDVHNIKGGVLRRYLPRKGNKK